MSEKYVVAFNRDRDFYQVPIALSKTDKLERLVTDFYTPDFIGQSKSLTNSFFQRRYTSWIPSRKVSGTMRALLLQGLIAMPFLKEKQRYQLFKTLDRVLSRKAGRIATKTNSNLLLYSGYAKEAFLTVEGKDIKRVLFVYHPHAELPEEILEADFKEHNRMRWSRNLHHLESKLSDNSRLSEEIQLADEIITASSFTKRSVQHVFPNQSNISVVPYGARLDYLDKPLVQSEKTQCKFLFVGQGVQRKGLHHLIDAWAANDIPNASLTLVCSIIDPDVEEIIRSQGIEVRKNLSNSELRNLFFESDIFIMPSLVEGFGLVYLEAMAAGCYVIGSRNTGLPDLGIEEQEGIILSAVNSHTVGEAITTSLKRWEDGDIRKNHIRTFVARFTWELFQDKVNNVLSRFGQS